MTNINSNYISRENLTEELPSDFQNKFRIKRTHTGKEELLKKGFDNLSITSERNFQINSSYENINIISRYKYIKDNNLQFKTKKFIINESTNNNKIKAGQFLKLPGAAKELQLSNIKDVSKSDFSSVIFDFDNNNKNSSSSLDRLNCEKKSIKKIKTKKKISLGNINDSNKLKNNEKKKSTNKLFDIRKLKRFPSSQNIMNCLKFNSPFTEDTKTKKKFVKKKSLNLNKKLNIISNNIKNTSKNINSPEEFYTTFFNNLLIKEPSVRYEKRKTITLAANSLPKKKNTNLSLKSNRIEKNISHSSGTSSKRAKNIKTLRIQTSLFNIN